MRFAEIEVPWGGMRVNPKPKLTNPWMVDQQVFWFDRIIDRTRRELFRFSEKPMRFHYQVSKLGGGSTEPARKLAVRLGRDIQPAVLGIKMIGFLSESTTIFSQTSRRKSVPFFGRI